MRPFASPISIGHLLAAALAVCAYAVEGLNVRGAPDSRVRDLASRVNPRYVKDVSSSTNVLAARGATAVSKNGPPEFTFDQLYKLQTRFLDNYLSPANTAQAKSINSTLLAENVQGRVDVTRTFDGRELNTEYLFGLFANIASTSSISLLGYPTSYEILQFAANENIASASTRFLFTFPAFSLTLPVEIMTWNAFNAAGEIEEYDATFRRFDWLLDTLITSAAAKLGANSTAAAQRTLTGLLANSICGTATQYCNGTNMQYSSAATCVEYLTTQVRFGKAYELGMNTLLCRSVHQTMVSFRPEVHCPHIGPSGGGYCTDDLTYVGVVEQDYYTNAPFIPYGYSGNNVSVAQGS